MNKYGPDGRLVVYVIKHYAEGFAGFYGGVDFHGGKGSTSSLADVARLVSLGCHAEDPAVQAEAEAMNGAAGAREGQQAAARSALDAVERRPRYVGTGRRR